MFLFTNSSSNDVQLWPSLEVGEAIHSPFTSVKQHSSKDVASELLSYLFVRLRFKAVTQDVMASLVDTY